MKTLLDRIVPKVDVLAANGCWKWTSNLDPQNGYGRVKVDGNWRRAHRIVYESLVGPIPDGLQLDHLCRNRACVNPDHLEPVTNYENWRRGDHPAAINQRTGKCQRGHSMDDAYVNAGTGWRVCRTCKREYVRRRYAEAKGTP